MNEATTMTRGKQALARVLEQLAGAIERAQDGTTTRLDTERLADLVWDDFKAAVADARAELRESEAEGVRKWQDIRHGQAGR